MWYYVQADFDQACELLDHTYWSSISWRTVSYGIMAYGSMPYVGMTPKKNGGHIKKSTNDMLEMSTLD